MINFKWNEMMFELYKRRDPDRIESISARVARSFVAKWDSRFLDVDFAKSIGNRRAYEYVPFHELPRAEQQHAIRAYPHKSRGAKYDFQPEHYFYPVKQDGTLARGQRVLAIPYNLLMNERYMESLGYEVNPDWKEASRSRMADEIDDFTRKLERGRYEWAAMFLNRKKPGKRPDKEVELKGQIARNIREVIQEIIKVEETNDYLWISFLGTKGRPDTYVFTHQPYSEVFQSAGAVPAKRKTVQISGDISRKLEEAGLRGLGTRHGKAGVQYSTGIENARRIAIGRRDMLLNVFLVSIGREDQMRRPDTRWILHKDFLLSKVDDRLVDQAVAWVKRGPTQVQVRDAAREKYQEDGDIGIMTGASKL